MSFKFQKCTYGFIYFSIPLFLYFCYYRDYLFPFDCTAIVVVGQDGIPLTGLTAPVGWWQLLQLTVRNGSVMVLSFGCLMSFVLSYGMFFLSWDWVISLHFSLSLYITGNM